MELGSWLSIKLKKTTIFNNTFSAQIVYLSNRIFAVSIRTAKPLFWRPSCVVCDVWRHFWLEITSGCHSRLKSFSCVSSLIFHQAGGGTQCLLHQTEKAESIQLWSWWHIQTGPPTLLAFSGGVDKNKACLNMLKFALERFNFAFTANVKRQTAGCCVS